MTMRKLVLFTLIVLGVQVVDSWLPLGTSFVASAQEAPAHDREAYSDRPDIRKLNALAMNGAPEIWVKLRSAHLAFVSFLLEQYPTQDIYFLARDSELLFDTAQLIGNGRDKERVHLLNVSRANMRDPHLKDYLDQEGLSEEALRKGKRAIFIDTGFAGTIPRIILSLFPEPLRAHLQTHLIVSDNPEHPSSRLFLSHLTRAANTAPLNSLHGDIVAYEYMPRYTERSDRYELIDGKWQPTEPSTPIENDGRVNKERAKVYMQDLKAFLESAETVKLGRYYRLAARAVFNVLLDPLRSGDEKLLSVRKFLANSNFLTPMLRESIVRDAFDSVKNTKASFGVSLTQVVQVKAAQVKAAQKAPEAAPKKFALAESHPELKPYLEDPETHLPKLFEAGDWKTIEFLLEAETGADLWSLLVKNLFLEPKSPKQSALQLKVFIEAGKSLNFFHRSVVLEEIPKRSTSTWMKELVKPLILSGDPELQKLAVIRLLNQPFSADLRQEISMLVDHANPEVLGYLLIQVFSRDFHADKLDILRNLLINGDRKIIETFLKKTASSRSVHNQIGLMRYALKRGLQEGLISEVADALVWVDEPLKFADIALEVVRTGDNFALRTLSRKGMTEEKFLEVPGVLRAFLENALPYHVEDFLRTTSLEKLRSLGGKYSFFADVAKVESVEARQALINSHQPTKKKIVRTCSKVFGQI